MVDSGSTQRVVVIGGGCAGVLVAAAALRAATADAPVHVDIVEPRDQLGRGVAYSTSDQQHVLNVPAARISARTDDPTGFVTWARRRDARIDDASFLPRAWYGEYLDDELRAATAAAANAGTGTVRHVRDRAVQVARASSSVTLESGEVLDADAVVLAIGNVDGPPAVPLPIDSRVFTSPWDGGALGPVKSRADAAAATVVLVGSGLTAVDAALSLTRDPDVRVIAVSRTGQFPFAHLPGALVPPTDMSELVASLGAQVTWEQLSTAVCAALGSNHDGPWRGVVDGLRPHVPTLWSRLGVDGQREFLARSMRAWEVRRHRMAPSVGEQLTSLLDAGRVELRAGGIDGFELRPDGVHIGIGGSVGAPVIADRVIACTGPVAQIHTSTNALLGALFQHGQLAPDAHDLGIRADAHGRVIDRARVVDPAMYVIGALRRGELWETTAVAEIRAQAEAIGARVATPRRASRVAPAAGR